MGLPQVILDFKTQSVTAIQRSAKGVVAIILKDSTDVTFDTQIYTSVADIDSTDWTAANLDYIKVVFLGTPSKVIVERIGGCQASCRLAINMYSS